MDNFTKKWCKSSAGLSTWACRACYLYYSYAQMLSLSLRLEKPDSRPGICTNACAQFIKYILRGFCVLTAANLLCATTVFWSGRKNGSCQDPSIVMVWLCPGEPCRWPLSSVRGQISFPAHVALPLPVLLDAESLIGTGSLCFCCWEMLQLI